MILFIVIVLILILYALTVFLILPKMIADRLENYQIKLADRQFEEIRSTYKEMRGWRHDYRNHMQVLKVYLDEGKIKQGKEYIMQMDKDLEDIDHIVKTGNVMADAILNSKLTLARSKNITVNVTAKIPEKLPVTDTEFCVIFGNLLDNAIEACEKIQEENDRFIRIYIGMFQKQFYLSVTNATSNSKRITAYRTVKGINHGLGLERIDNIVNKHQGFLNRKNEPGVFVTEIMLPFAS
ncbi:MAG: GHKL domain-containing protein [Lachnospiraceae bacterium]|nr:GHKL domain-containing protein [Lachnospiraceae bacterium]